MSTGQARRQIPDLSGKGYCHESLETLARSRPPDGTFNLRESRSAGGKRHGEQAAVDGCIGVIDILYFRINRRRCGGSRILQAICPGGAEPGARRIGQSALRRRPARLPMVVGFCGSLRMVSGSILWRRRHRARRADAISERLYRPLILAPGASPSSGPNLTFRFAWGFPEELACANLGDARANEHSFEPSRPQQA